jgi:chromosome segregation ATPase
MRCNLRRLALALLALSFTSVGAHADAEADRLREALRNATVRARALEDERAGLLAKLTEADREKADLKAQIDATEAQAKEDVERAEKQQQEAVEEFNSRLAERDKTLEKWKGAYEEAAGVARSKDAERAKFQAQATAFKASGKKCLAKNAQLIKVGRDLLERYEALTPGDTIAAREPFTQFERVEVEKLLQDYTDKVLDQKVDP